jgi:hypothetical protein
MRSRKVIGLYVFLISVCIAGNGCFSLTDEAGNEADIDLLRGETTITSPAGRPLYEYDRERRRALIYDERTGIEDVVRFPTNEHLRGPR